MQPQSSVTARLVDFATGHRFLAAFGLMVVSTLFLLPELNAEMRGDVVVFQGIAGDLLRGAMPYRDRVVEYPPYAVPIFLLPCVFGEGNYLTGFLLLAFVTDWLIKLSLFAVGFQQPNSARALSPLLLYCVAGPFIHYFYLQRYDLWPALISLLAIWLFCSKHYLASGVAVALGMGVKLYPLLFVPPLLVLAWRQHHGMRFFAGLAWGLLPIALLSFWLPWWRFAEFQSARGLQVESLYAAILWMGQLMGIVKVHWTYTNKWYEVQGPWVSALLPWVRGLFIIAVGGSTVLVAWTAATLPRITIPQVSRLLLVPVLAFVAFNQVLSPQYLIWLLPLAAVASLEGKPWAFSAISFATVLTPIFYPVPEYYHGGLNAIETIILLFRNGMLVTLWAWLLRDCCLHLGKTRVSDKPTNKSSGASVGSELPPSLIRW